MQSGGTNAASGLYLGYYPASSGSYALGPSGTLSADSEYIGFSGTGTFTQSGGSNTVSSALYLGVGPFSSGTYNLNGGTLIVSAMSGWSGTAAFNFSGGTLQAGARFSTDLPIALAASGGNGTIDTAGLVVTLAGPLSGPGGLIKAGSGTLIVTAANTYAGGTTISGGTLQLDSGGATGSIPDGAVLNNGTLAFNRSDSYTVTGPISGSGNVTQIGPGTLTLAGPNDYSGTTLVSGGTLALAHSAALQQSTLDTSGGGGVSFGSLTAATLGGLTGSGPLVLENTAAAPVALAVGNNGAGTIYSGVLSGSGSLTKVGSGTLTLTGSNTYSGGTTISGGTLQIDNGGSSGAIPDGIVNNGTLAFNRSDTYVVSSPISGSGNLTQIGPGTLTLAGPNDYSGTTLVSGGTLALANSAALQQSTLDTSGAGGVSFGSLTAARLGGLTGSGPLALDNTAAAPVALAVGNNGAGATYSGVLSGSGSLTKVGSGTLALTGSNTYSGGTSVVSGELALQNRSAILSGSLLSIGANSSVVLGNSAFHEPLGQLSGSDPAGPLGSQPSGTAYSVEPGGSQVSPAPGTVNAVPEPGTMALLTAAAACGLAAWQRRRRG